MESLLRLEKKKLVDDLIMSKGHATAGQYPILKDLNIKPSDVEDAMKKWLWRFKDGGEFAKV